MADRALRVRLSADIGAYTAALAAAASKTSEFASKSQAALQKNSAALGTLSTGMMGFGAVVAGGMVVAAKSFADFDSQMSAVKATGDDAASNIDALRQAAIQAGEAFGQFDATQAAQGIEQLAKAGLSADQILSGGLNGALALAAAGEMQVGDAAEVTAKTLKQFELAGSDASHVADLLAAGAGKAVGDVSDLGMALAQAGTVANQYGVSVEETVGTLALFADNALLGSDAGTSMKTMLLQLAQPTKQAQAVLDEYNISAYDAQGNFVGMENLAGQLKTQLGGLSQAQQNAALKTIFGSDAIRAANILMNQGAEGVAEYTAAVDDQGFAMEVAATKADNLKGDLEELSGSLQTGLIQAGSGANDMLRGLVQSITGVVDAFNAMDPGKQQALVGTVAALGGLALVGGAAVKAAVAISNFNAALISLGIAPKIAAGVQLLAPAFTSSAGAAAALRASLTGVMASLGPLSLALGAFAVAGLAVNLIPPVATANAEQFTTALTSLAKGATNAAKEMDAMAAAGTQNWGYKDKVTDLEGMIRVAEKSNFLVKGIGNIGQAIHANDTQFTSSKKNLAELDAALSGMNIDTAAASFEHVAESAKKAGLGADEMAQAFPKSFAALRQLASEAGVASLSNQELADWMGGKMPPAVAKAADAAAAAGQPIDGLATANSKAAATAEQMAEAADAQFAALQKLANQALATSGSMIGFEAAVDAASKAVSENGKTLDIGTEAGRANRTALDSIASSALKVVEAQRTAGASGQELAAVTGRARSEFINAATAMGMSSAAANKLADSYGLVPSDVSTTVSAPGAVASKQQVDELNRRIAALPPSKRAEIQSIFNRSGYDAANSALNSINGKTSTTFIVTQYVTKGSREVTAPVPRAYGGPVYGPGTTTSDSIPALLSNREFVHQAAAHDYYGSRLMWAINQRQIPREVFAQYGFAGGGSPSAPTAPMPSWTPPAPTAAQVAMQMPPIYVQNPFTGEYLLAQVRGVANSAIATNAADRRRIGAFQ